MLVFEFKAYGKRQQFNAVDEALQTVQFIRNKANRLWMDRQKINKFDLNKYCAILAKEFPFCDELNSMACQTSAEGAWSAISLFHENYKKKAIGKKGFPQFQKYNCFVEYKTSGWKLTDDRKSIIFTDVCKCGCVLDRDHNAARNILSRGFCTVGHTGTWAKTLNSCGEMTSTDAGEILHQQVASMNQESQCL